MEVEGGKVLPGEKSVPVSSLNRLSLSSDQNKQELNKGNFCMPGQKLCVANEYFEAGDGAYEFGQAIYASVLGYLSVQEFPDQELTVVSVIRGEGQRPFASPNLMAIVTCTVASRTRNLCRCLITHVGNAKLDEPLRGIIRREYITDCQRDLTEIETSFGIGDILLARVVGIGDGDFIMSTAEDGLGVATAVSSAGYFMVPVGWTKMECPKTKEVVSRKVAKIIQDRNVTYWHDRNSPKKSQGSISSPSGRRGSTSGDESE